ncbi:MAG: hypothetical protein V8R52_13285 [Coprobacter fastidiosus]
MAFEQALFEIPYHKKRAKFDWARQTLEELDDIALHWESINLS